MVRNVFTALTRKEQHLQYLIPDLGLYHPNYSPQFPEKDFGVHKTRLNADSGYVGKIIIILFFWLSFELKGSYLGYRINVLN